MRRNPLDSESAVERLSGRTKKLDKRVVEMVPHSFAQKVEADGGEMQAIQTAIISTMAQKPIRVNPARAGM